MRLLIAFFLILGIVGFFAYLKRRELSDFASTFVADRVAHALNNPDAEESTGESSDLAKFGVDFAKNVGKKTLARLQPQAILGRF